MSQLTSDKKKIAKNTLFLYFRLLFTIVVSLYTSRVVLQVLGVSDFGIYNVVGGFINMLAFLNLGMTGASQRFLSYEIGKGDGQRIHLVFCTSVITHFAIAAIVFTLMEIFGVWILNSYMNIPEERMTAANWVLQFSILTFCFSTINVPFNSCIVAHEHMNVYAYISIADVVLKLAIVFIIQFVTFDLLILYAFLIFIVQIIIQLIYYFYCRRHFEECHISALFDKKLFKEMFSFAGWNMIGHLGFSFKGQGVNIIINLFLGTAVNAAFGIARQVNGVVNNFAYNFSMAMNPQIIKLYAAGSNEESLKLSYSGARFTFFLLTMIAIPLIINMDYVLKLWLGDVPGYTSILAIVVLLNSAINSMSNTITTAIYARGHVKLFQTSLAALLLLELPAAYVILKLGGTPYEAILPSLITVSLSLLLRIVILKRYESACCVKEYLLDCIVRCVLIFLIGYGLSCFIYSIVGGNTLYSLILNTVISIVTYGLIVFLLGLKQNERKMILRKVQGLINYRNNK